MIRTQAKRELSLAAEALLRGDYSYARRAVLAAVRFNPDLKANKEVQDFYESILRQERWRSYERVDDFAEWIKNLPQSWSERVWGYEWVRFIVYLIYGLNILIQLMRI